MPFAYKNHHDFTTVYPERPFAVETNAFSSTYECNTPISPVESHHSGSSQNEYQNQGSSYNDSVVVHQEAAMHPVEEVPQRMRLQIAYGFMKSSDEKEQQSKKSSAKKPADKRSRTSFTADQIMKLEEQFSKNRYLLNPGRSVVAKDLHLSQRTVKIWFQNRRMKSKKQNERCNNIRTIAPHAVPNPRQRSSSCSPLNDGFDLSSSPAVSPTHQVQLPQQQMWQYQALPAPQYPANNIQQRGGHIGYNPTTYQVQNQHFMTSYPEYSQQHQHYQQNQLYSNAEYAEMADLAINMLFNQP